MTDIESRFSLVVQEKLRSPDIINVGIDHVRKSFIKVDQSLVGLCLGWEIAWEVLTPEVIGQAMGAYHKMMSLESKHNTESGDDKPTMEKHYPNTWYGVVPQLLQAIADATGKRVYVSMYVVSGWNARYDQLVTLEFVPGSKEPKQYDSL